MPEGFDPRIVGPEVLAFLQACQRAVPFHLGGGAALAGVHLRHRMSADADLFLHDRLSHRDLVRALPGIGVANGMPVSILRDAGTFVRSRLEWSGGSIYVDVVFDAVPDLQPPPPPVDGVVVESLADLLFLDRAGYPPERDLPLALKKDAGVDPGVLAWLLAQFPLEPLPVMLVPFEVDELRAFRDALSERFRRAAIPSEASDDHGGE